MAWIQRSVMCLHLCIALVYFLLSFAETKSESLQCVGKHITDNMELSGLFHANSCKREIEGQQLNSSDCTIWDYANTDANSDCSNLGFSSDPGDYLSDIQIHPYTNDDNLNLNITFKNIKWHYMQYRQQIENMVSCQKMQLTESFKVRDDLRLSFACKVWGYWVSGNDMELLLDVGESPSHITSHAHFLIKMPEDVARVDPSKSNLTNWIILLAVDIAHVPYLMVHWPTVPEKFGVTEYKIQLAGSKPHHVGLSSCQNGYCSLEMFAGYGSGRVSVSIQPVHELCSTSVSCQSFSSEFDLEFSFPYYFIVMIAVAFFLCLLIVICSIYYFCCAAPRKQPVLLILYDATEIQHCRVVRILAEYLKNVGKMRCLVADEEVPQSESKNASKWLHKVFDEVDAVLVVASPMVHPEIRYSVYPNVLYEALPLITQKTQCPMHTESGGRYLVAVPPYCSSEDIPHGLEGMPRVHLPQDLSFLMWSVYNQHIWGPKLACFAKAYLLLCWCPGPMSAYRKYGGRLAEALKVAGAAQMVVEQAPPTPKSSRFTNWTTRNPLDTEDHVSIPPYPGNVNRLPLLGGSIVSEESVDPEMAVNLNTLSL